jgi:hypothetical protein
MAVIMPGVTPFWGDRALQSAAAIGPRPAFHEVPVGEHRPTAPLALKLAFGLEPEFDLVAMRAAAQVPELEGSETNVAFGPRRLGGHALVLAMVGIEGHGRSHSYAEGVAGEVLCEAA